MSERTSQVADSIASVFSWILNGLATLITLGSLTAILPPIASVLAIVMFLIGIYESAPARRYRERRRLRRIEYHRQRIERLAVEQDERERVAHALLRRE